MDAWGADIRVYGMTHALRIKALSVNEAWKGRRFKTDAYKDYEAALLLMLPRLSIPKGKLSLSITVAFSNANSDCDNILKPLIDILQKKYGFNDNRIYRLTIDKLICKKGAEYISFSFGSL